MTVHAEDAELHEVLATMIMSIGKDVLSKSPVHDSVVLFTETNTRL